MRIVWDSDSAEELPKGCSSRRAMKIAHERAPDGMEHITSTVFVGWTIQSAFGKTLNSGSRRIDPQPPVCGFDEDRVRRPEHEWVRTGRTEERCPHCGTRKVERLGRNEITGEDQVWLLRYIPAEE